MLVAENGNTAIRQRLSLNQLIFSLAFFALLLLVLNSAPSNAFAESAPSIRLTLDGNNVVRLSIKVSSRHKLARSRIRIIRSENGNKKFRKLASIRIGKLRSFNLMDQVSSNFRSVSYRSRLVGKVTSRWSRVAKVVLVANVAEQSNTEDDYLDEAGAPQSPSTSIPIIDPSNYSLPAGYKICPASVRAEIIQAANSLRVSSGVAALKEEPHLALSSLRFAIGMATASSISHEGWYNNILATGFVGTSFGQNIAYTTSVSSSSVMSGWVSSAPHRLNIQKANFAYTGVGCVQDTKGIVWWAQDFGA